MYKYIFSRVYDPFMRSIEKYELQKRRKKLLNDLSGDILEIGSGTGINFPLYKNDCTVYALEPNVHMWDIANAKKKHSCTIHPIITNIEEIDEKEFELPKYFDAIVCTLVLCNVSDTMRTIQWIDQRLKVNGKLIILEHIRSHAKFSAIFQDIIAPTWKFFADGCNINRPTDLLLKDLNYVVKEEEYFSLSIPFYRAILQKQK